MKISPIVYRNTIPFVHGGGAAIVGVGTNITSEFSRVYDGLEILLKKGI